MLNIYNRFVLLYLRGFVVQNDNIFVCFLS